MNDEKLIEFVRLNPALYNLGNPKYLDTKYKNYLWRKLALELKLNEKDFNICKNRWTNIRDQYKKYLKNEKTVTGQAATMKKKYKYADLLKFLKGCEDDRKGHSNFSFSQHNPVLTEKKAAEKESTDDILAIDAPAHTFTKEKEDERSNDDMPLLPTPPISHSIGKRKATPNVSASHTLMKYVIENNKKKKEENKPIHPIDAFLNGLAPTLKLLSPYNQHVAKGQIFRIVHDLELQELFEKNLSSSSSPSFTLQNSPTISRPVSQSSHSSPSHQVVIAEGHPPLPQQIDNAEAQPNSYIDTSSSFFNNTLTSSPPVPSSPSHQVVIAEVYAPPPQQLDNAEAQPNSYTDTQSVRNYLAAFNDGSV